MKKIVLINPPLTSEERYGTRFMAGGNPPPLGLANLAAMTRANGYETSIIDAAALGLNTSTIVKMVLDAGRPYVGITGATIAFDNMARLAGELKSADRNIKVIAGGPHLTAVPEETLRRCQDFDIGVIGEADYTLVELLNTLEGGVPLDGVPGLILRQNGNLYRTALREPIRDMDALPMPAWDLLPDMGRFYCPPAHTVKRIPAALLIASRGCPGQCIFCDRSVFGNHLRAYSARYTLAMIKELYEKYGIREVQLRDDNFLAFRKRMVELCGLLKQEKLDIVWTCAGRVDMINPEILKLMKQAGCWQIWYGIESGSQTVLDAIKKHTRLDQIEKTIEMTRAAGIEPCGFFIIGNPTETRETLGATLEFALRLPLAEAHFSIMTPFPGSEIYDRASEFGTFDNDWKKLNGWQPVFVPYGLTSADLTRSSQKALRAFYFRPRLILGYLKKIRSFRHIKVYLRGLLALVEFLLKGKSPNSPVAPG
jgi:anaerobic magnesium-protoporphyrin IX monomethyl ester cyclase